VEGTFQLLRYQLRINAVGHDFGLHPGAEDRGSSGSHGGHGESHLRVDRVDTIDSDEVFDDRSVEGVPSEVETKDEEINVGALRYDLEMVRREDLDQKKVPDLEAEGEKEGQRRDPQNDADRGRSEMFPVTNKIRQDGAHPPPADHRSLPSPTSSKPSRM